MSASQNQETTARVAFDLTTRFMQSTAAHMATFSADPSVTPDQLRRGVLRAHAEATHGLIVGCFPKEERDTIVEGFTVYLRTCVQLGEVKR